RGSPPLGCATCWSPVRTARRYWLASSARCRPRRKTCWPTCLAIPAPRAPRTDDGRGDPRAAVRYGLPRPDRPAVGEAPSAPACDLVDQRRRPRLGAERRGRAWPARRRLTGPGPRSDRPRSLVALNLATPRPDRAGRRSPRPPRGAG